MSSRARGHEEAGPDEQGRPAAVLAERRPELSDYLSESDMDRLADMLAAVIISTAERRWKRDRERLGEGTG